MKSGSSSCQFTETSRQSRGWLKLRGSLPKSVELYKQNLRRFTEWDTINGKRLVEDDGEGFALAGFMKERIFAGV